MEFRVSPDHGVKNPTKPKKNISYLDRIYTWLAHLYWIQIVIQQGGFYSRSFRWAAWTGCTWRDRCLITTHVSCFRNLQASVVLHWPSWFPTGLPFIPSGRTRFAWSCWRVSWHLVLVTITSNKIVSFVRWLLHISASVSSCIRMHRFWLAHLKGFMNREIIEEFWKLRIFFEFIIHTVNEAGFSWKELCYTAINGLIT